MSISPISQAVRQYYPIQGVLEKIRKDEGLGKATDQSVKGLLRLALLSRQFRILISMELSSLICRLIIRPSPQIARHLVTRQFPQGMIRVKMGSEKNQPLWIDATLPRDEMEKLISEVPKESPEISEFLKTIVPSD